MKREELVEVVALAMFLDGNETQRQYWPLLPDWVRDGWKSKARRVTDEIEKTFGPLV